MPYAIPISQTKSIPLLARPGAAAVHDIPSFSADGSAVMAREPGTSPKFRCHPRLDRGWGKTRIPEGTGMTHGGTGGYLGRQRKRYLHRLVLRQRDTHNAAKTCTQTAIIPTKRAMEVSAAASSTTARN